MNSQASEIAEKIMSIDNADTLTGMKRQLQSDGHMTEELGRAFDVRISHLRGEDAGSAFSITADELRQMIERIEQHEAKKKDISGQIREVYAEAKGRGFDTKALRKIVAMRKLSADDRHEQEAIMEVYMNALGMT